MDARARSVDGCRALGLPVKQVFAKHLKHSFTSALDDAEIEDFRCHDLSHTFGTLVVD